MADEGEDGANLNQAIPFFRVADMQASLRFYLDGLGFRIARKWVVDDEIRWCLLERGRVALMIQHFLTEGGNWRPEGKAGEGVTICIMCDDALALYRELRSRGIDASRPFVGNALWVTSVTDPDGFRIDFESSTEAPEESEYSED